MMVKEKVAPSRRREADATLARTALPGAQVRCACDRCGAHVMATETPGRRYEGICRICGHTAVTPVR